MRASIARALHRRALGADRPFVVCDPRRRDGTDYESVRSPVNYGTGVAAFDAAVGGSLCVRSRRLPRDFSSVVARIRATSDVQIIVCSDGRDDTHPYLILPVPIRVPSLAVRTDELPRIVDEYALDAVAELRTLGEGFTAADRQWVLRNRRGPALIDGLDGEIRIGVHELREQGDGAVEGARAVAGRAVPRSLRDLVRARCGRIPDRRIARRPLTRMPEPLLALCPASHFVRLLVSSVAIEIRLLARRNHQRLRVPAASTASWIANFNHAATGLRSCFAIRSTAA